jgi:cob(I)alamin adenosyltransferase
MREAIAVKIYTRKGDAGQTGIWGGVRLGKDDLRVEAIGTVDECNAAIGVALAGGIPENIGRMMRQVQSALFVVGSDLMAPDRTGPEDSVPRVSDDDPGRLERAIDELETGLPALRNFIVPRRHAGRGACASCPHGVPPGGAPGDAAGQARGPSQQRGSGIPQPAVRPAVRRGTVPEPHGGSRGHCLVG